MRDVMASMPSRRSRATHFVALRGGAMEDVTVLIAAVARNCCCGRGGAAAGRGRRLR